MDGFPQGYMHTVNWIFQNIAGDLIEKHQLLVNFIAIAYCFKEIVYEKRVLENMVKLLGDEPESDVLFTDNKEKFEYLKFFT